MPETKSSARDNSATTEALISPGEIIIGELAGIDNAGRPQVIFADMPVSEALIAMTTQEVTHKHIGRQVALLFANGETSRPVIVGLIHNPLSEMLENFALPETLPGEETPFPEVSLEQAEVPEIGRDEQDQVIVDGKRVTIQGAEEVTLKCGKASITLTKAGKILIRGTYLSNRSSGVNRILGGSVQIN